MATEQSQSAGAKMAPELSERLPLAEVVHNPSVEAVLDAASDPGLTEELALTLLKRNDLSPQVLERLTKNAAITKYRKVKLALVEHPRMPRHLSLPVVRHLYTFDLMLIALKPTVASDVRAAADDGLIKRLETISEGEKLALARRASGVVAGRLLLESEPRVIAAALGNSRLTEALVVKAVAHPDAPAALAEAVCRHPGWSVRCEIRIALLRGRNMPLAQALEFARSLPAGLAREVLHGSRLPDNLKEGLLKDLNTRSEEKANAARS